MALTLRAIGSGMIPGDLETVTMEGGVLTIGRGEDNDLTLPDPERHISKRHCVLEQRGGDYFLLDVSTNGTFLNQGPDRIGDQPMPLNDGDTISVGRYELRVEIQHEAESFGGAFDPLDDLPAPAEQTSISSAAGQGRGRYGENEALVDPLAGEDEEDMFGALDAPPPGGRREALPGDPVGLARQDPFKRVDPLAGPDGREVTGASLLPEDDDDLLGALGEEEKDLLGGDGPASDHVPEQQGYYKPPTAQAPSPGGGGQPLIGDDFDEEFGGGGGGGGGAGADPFADPFDPGSGADLPPLPEEPEVAPAPPSEPEPPAGPPPEPPAAARPRPPEPEPAPRRPAAAPSGAEAEAARAFLRAAGAGQVQVSDAELVETMERLGGAFRVMVAGLREVLMTRKSIKDEFRVSQTQIQANGNNPLKFSVSPEQAIEAMVRPAVPGYLPSDQAAEQALADIKAHEVATMTGMQAALKAILVRLDPAALVSRLEREGGLLDMLSGKKARYWEVYEELYGQIAREAEDDFQTLFGREFARAYEEQLKKLSDR